MVVIILENEEKLSHKEALNAAKLLKLKKIDIADRTEVEKKKIAEKEMKQADLRIQILLSFKFIADLVQAGFIDISNIREILKTLIKNNEDHIDFFNLGKIILVFCTLAN